MAIRPLHVAMAAAALLVMTLAVDVAVTRTAKLEVNDAGTWRTVIVDPSTDPYATSYRSVAPQRVDPNGTLEFRLTLDNEYPWAWTEEYVLLANGRELARGTLDAPARGVANVTVSVPVTDLRTGPGGPYEPVKADTDYAYPSLELTLGGRILYGSLALEVAR